jgi:hypothetical protein
MPSALFKTASEDWSRELLMQHQPKLVVCALESQQGAATSATLSRTYLLPAWRIGRKNNGWPTSFPALQLRPMLLQWREQQQQQQWWRQQCSGLAVNK